MEALLLALWKHIPRHIDESTAEEIGALMYDLQTRSGAHTDIWKLADCVACVAHRKHQRAIMLELCKIPVLEQRSPEWHAMRTTLLTASDLGQCLGKGKFGTRLDLLRKKVGGGGAFLSGSSPPLKWGTMYEAVGLRCYRARQNWIGVQEFGLLQHPNLKVFGASPDGITDLGVMVELKCPYRRVKVVGEMPEQYSLQIQGQLEVCNLDDCDYVECYLEEFRDEPDYVSSIGAMNEAVDHGAVLEFTVEGKGVNEWGASTELMYEYSPDELEQTEDVIEWVNERAQTLHLQRPELHLTKIHYWRLKDIQLIRVRRDRALFAEVSPKIQAFWDEVVGARIDPTLIPDKVVREKRVLRVVDDTKTTKTKFMFKDDE